MTSSDPPRLRIVILGLTITSSWGNGHATTYRGLVAALARRGHRVLFLERDKPWYAANRDLPNPPCGRTVLYDRLEALEHEHAAALRGADLVIVGSYVPEGIAVGRLVQRLAGGVTAFYDIDTPVTLAALAAGRCDYLAPELVAGYDLYLSFTGGPTLAELEQRFGAPMARPLYCAVDPATHHPDPAARPRWDLGYLGTYSPDRQPALDRLLRRPAALLPDRRFVVAGPQYPAAITWEPNVQRIEHLPPDRHRAFYCAQRYTLNVTRADMVARGHSPSVRLFEAAACGVPIISDRWPGIETLLRPGEEILIADSEREVLSILRDLPEARRQAIAAAARARVLAGHTADHRAAELESHLAAARALRAAA